jgi:hypothetical protein
MDGALLLGVVILLAPIFVVVCVGEGGKDILDKGRYLKALTSKLAEEGELSSLLAVDGRAELR